MSIQRLHKLLNSGKDYIKINQDLLKTLNIEEAVLYTYLVNKYQKHLKSETYRYFNDDDIYFLCGVEDIEKILGLSSFRQRAVLSKLEKKSLLKVKLGKARTRYISINEDVTVLEELLYGSSFARYQTELMKLYTAQLNLFKEQNNLNINNDYLLNYATPWKDILTNDLKVNSKGFDKISLPDMKYYDLIKPFLEKENNKSYEKIRA